SRRVAGAAVSKIRRCSDGSELCPRYDLRERGTGTVVTNPVDGRLASGDGDDGLEQCRFSGRGNAARRLGFHPEALGEPRVAGEIARPGATVPGTAAFATAARGRIAGRTGDPGQLAVEDFARN